MTIPDISTTATIEAVAVARGLLDRQIDVPADPFRVTDGKTVRVASLTMRLDGDGKSEYSGYGFLVKKDGSLGEQNRRLYHVEQQAIPAWLHELMLTEAAARLRYEIGRVRA